MRVLTSEKIQMNASENIHPKRKRRRALSDVGVWVASVIVFIFILCALLPGWIAPYGPTELFQDRTLQSPSLSHWMGTDHYGRDVLTMVIHGARDSLVIGFAAVAIGLFAGGLVGAIAGYAGGVIEGVLMRLIDILMAIPGVLLALVIALALGPSLQNLILAIAIAAIPGYARVIRGQVKSTKQRPYITASRAIGLNPIRTFKRHIMPNVYAPILVMATVGVGSSLLVGAGLSFLGLGVIKEIPDWGTLLSQGRNYLTVAWWTVTFPGLAITLFVLSINIVGDYLRDRLDPRRSI
ncbi:ABC transporter permease [Geomicrobium sp. JCM 19039]|uniref:ABC transporter permease n=1 Tax=Geomicrobium sp. JCM 19039 TaxID=1460636 RepID=UPI00045F3DD9|nr:ABC transporter permease [Geomicrobium sp. JCM 19039]GAK13053.1 dipeptide transport system permease protein DppC [Geomicrobium sp. JCM 19039]